MIRCNPLSAKGQTSRVIPLATAKSPAGLNYLRRQTGLDFASYPTSLISAEQPLTIVIPQESRTAKSWRVSNTPAKAIHMI